MLIEDNNLKRILNKIIEKKSITRKDSFFISSRVDIWDLLYGAHIIRRRFFDNKIHLCSIVNAKSGNCSENCKFCAQSFRHATKIKTYNLLSSKAIKKAYFRAKANKVTGFSIVTSGNRLANQEIDRLCKIVQELCAQKKGPYLCLSVGRLTPQTIIRLKESGITKCHHNLETSRSFFSKICTTHSYNDRIVTVLNLKRAGIKVCSGGIFGLGESWRDRINLAFMLKKLNVDSVPLNFLMPVKGTPLGKMKSLSPMEALKIIAIFRYILPDTDIRICAGREKVLRDYQSLIFYAGATGMMVGGYLTQAGRAATDDFQMLADSGLKS